MPNYGKVKVNTLTYDSSGSAVDLAVGDIAPKANPTFTGTINGATAVLTGNLTVDTNTLHVDATNNRVGMGTTSPSSIFHCRPLDETNFLIRNEGSNVVLASETNSGRDNNRGLDFEATQFTFIEGGTERMRVGPSGQLGIAGANYGTSGQVLTSGGASAAPSWADASSGALGYDLWTVTAQFGYYREWDYEQAWGSAQTFTNDGGSGAAEYGPGPATMSIARCTTSQNPLFAKVGTGMSMSAGVWTFPNTGEWKVTFAPSASEKNTSGGGHNLYIWTTSDNGSNWHEALKTRNRSHDAQWGYVPFNLTVLRVNITDTSNQKVKFGMGDGDGRTKVWGATDKIESHFIFEQIS